MSLATRIESLVIRVAQEFNDVRAKAGNLANLNTTDKSSLVAAINELQSAVLSGTGIDDANVALTTTYSSTKIVTLLDTLKTEILGADVERPESFRAVAPRRAVGGGGDQQARRVMLHPAIHGFHDDVPFPQT